VVSKMMTRSLGARVSVGALADIICGDLGACSKAGLRS
jgi:hypothetical protein